MEKTITLFQKDPGGLVRNEVTPGAEWVMEGEGIATKMIVSGKKGKKQKEEIVLDELKGIERSFFSIENAFKATDLDGIVWIHEDERMVKIKASDFGIKRKVEHVKRQSDSENRPVQDKTASAHSEHGSSKRDMD